MKKLSILVAIALVATGGMAAVAARRATYVSPGGIALDTDTALHQKAPVDWSWHGGKYVRSTSRVDILRQVAGHPRYVVARAVPISRGAYIWDTTGVADGTYTLTALVEGTSVVSNPAAVTVDNTAPGLRILSPAEGQVSSADAGVDQAVPAIVEGPTTLLAEGVDAGTGIASVSWFLDGEDITTDLQTTVVQGSNGAAQASTQYDFTCPGQHLLQASATDAAGNVSELAAVDVIALPNPNDASMFAGCSQFSTPDPGSIVPTDAPVPSGVPTDVPDPGSIVPSDAPVPSVAPSDVPDPGGIVPTSAPDPGSVVPSDAPVPSGVPTDAPAGLPTPGA